MITTRTIKRKIGKKIAKLVYPKIFIDVEEQRVYQKKRDKERTQLLNSKDREFAYLFLSTHDQTYLTIEMYKAIKNAWKDTDLIMYRFPVTALAVDERNKLVYEWDYSFIEMSVEVLLFLEKIGFFIDKNGK